MLSYFYFCFSICLEEVIAEKRRG